MSNKLTVRRISACDDLDQLARDIDSAEWDDDNDMGDFSVESMQEYLADDSRILMVAHREGQLAGVSSAAILLKPYAHERWLYVDEVDVAVNFRRQGVGRAMMKELLQLAKSHDCLELYLGTEHDNEAAQRLYESVNPDTVEKVVGFTYRIDA